MGKRNRKVVSASLATALVASGSPYVASFAQDVQEAASQVQPNPVSTASQTLDTTANAASSSPTAVPTLATVSAWPTAQGENKTDNAQVEPPLSLVLLRVLSPPLAPSLSRVLRPLRMLRPARILLRSLLTSPQLLLVRLQARRLPLNLPLRRPLLLTQVPNRVLLLSQLRRLSRL